MGMSLWTHCPHPWSGIFPTAGAMEGVGVGSHSASLSTSHPHSPVTGSQSLAAITAIKTINALRSGSTFDLLGCRWNQHCCVSGKVLFTRARCSFSWLPCCSSTVKFALGWVWVCVESSAVIRPQILAAALLLFSLSGCALFWVPCHPQGRTSLMDTPVLIQDFLLWESLALSSLSLRICSC